MSKILAFTKPKEYFEAWNGVTFKSGRYDQYDGQVYVTIYCSEYKKNQICRALNTTAKDLGNDKYELCIS